MFDELRPLFLLLGILWSVFAWAVGAYTIARWFARYVTEPKQQLQWDATRLIKSAKAKGYIVRIDLKSNAPLAMGHYEMVPEVRESRALQQKNQAKGN